MEQEVVPTPPEAGPPPPPEAAPPPPGQQGAPIPEPQAEVLVGEKDRQRDELWGNVSVAMQLQGESPRMGDFMFGRLIEPDEEDDGSSLEGSG